MDEIIDLNVGGRKYTTTKSTLTKKKDSMLYAMFSGSYNHKKDKKGNIFIDRNGDRFQYVLDFLRDGTLVDDELVEQELIYFGLVNPSEGNLNTLELELPSYKYTPKKVFFIGYAFWDQDGTKQTLEQQHELMIKAAKEQLPGTRPATVVEYVNKFIESLPKTNTSGFCVTFLGPGNMGTYDKSKVILRGVSNGSALDGTFDTGNLYVHTRTILCVAEE